MRPARTFQHPEIATLGACSHTKHHHGWWCALCLRATLPGVIVTHGARGVWEAKWRGAIGYGSRKVHALQSCVEAARTGGDS